MWLRILILFLVTFITGCESLSYYSQAVAGQWALLSQRQAIETLVASEATDPALKTSLLKITAIREFASDELQLPFNKSYRYYVDMQREYVVWNVVAAEEFSVEPRQWCFPIAGCVSYRGYFDHQRALHYAARLQQQGYDIYVGGVAAYSTLGWFADPVLNTFLQHDDIRMAGLVFHELAHQLVYVPGDTAFNESFARAVELAGVQRWLLHHSLQLSTTVADNSAQLMSAYQQRQAMQEDFVATVLQLREQLHESYQQPLSAAAMSAVKRQRLQQFISEDYQAFKQRWDNTTVYDDWLGSGLNNAKLASLANYHQWLPAFQRLLAQSEDDFAGFYLRVAELSELDSEQRRSALERLNRPE